MSRIFITIGSAHSKAANVNPVDGIWCSDCGWAGRVEEDMTDSEESEEPLFEEFSEYVPKFCPKLRGEPAKTLEVSRQRDT